MNTMPFAFADNVVVPLIAFPVPITFPSDDKSRADSLGFRPLIVIKPLSVCTVMPRLMAVMAVGFWPVSESQYKVAVVVSDCMKPSATA